MGVGGIIYEAIQKFIYINKIQAGKRGCLLNPPWTSRRLGQMRYQMKACDLPDKDHFCDQVVETGFN